MRRRQRGTWAGGDVHERFGYRCGDAELSRWAPRLRRLAEAAETTHVLMNNCDAGYAQANARQLIDLLAGADAPDRVADPARH